MAGFYITKKSVPSTASEAASGVMEKKTAKQVSKGKMKTGKGHFAAAAQRIAKLRSGHLQHGIPKHAPTGIAGNVGKSGIVKKLDSGLKVQASEGQTGLNPEQQGASEKKSKKLRGLI